MVRGVRAGEAFVEILTVTTQFEKGLARAKRKLTDFGKQVTQIGLALTGLSAALATPFIAGAKLFANFETSLAKIGTLINNDEQQIASFGKSVAELSTRFGKSTDDIASALFDIVSAVIPADQAIDVLTASLKLSQAGFTDTATATSAVITVMKAYGDAVIDATDASDFLFQTAKFGRTTFESLAQNIGGVATIAALGGLKLEELGAALATVTRSGLSTEEAVTTLRALVISFLKPADGAAEAAKGFGLELKSTTLATEGLVGVLQKIGNLPPDVIARIFPNVRAIKGFLPLVAAADDFRRDIEEIGNRAGVTETALERVSKTLNVLAARLEQVGAAILRNLGATFEGAIKRAADGIITFFNQVNMAVKNNAEFVKTAVKVIAVMGTVGIAMIAAGAAVTALGIAIGAVGSVVGFVVSALSILSGALALVSAALATTISFTGIAAGAFVGLEAAMLALISPVGLVILGVVAIGVVILSLTDIIEDTTKFFKEGFGSIVNFVSDAFSEISARIKKGDIVGAISVATEKFKTLWVSVLDDIIDRFDNFVSIVRNFATKTALLISKSPLELVTNASGIQKELDALDDALERTIKKRAKASRKRLSDIRAEGLAERKRIENNAASSAAAVELLASARKKQTLDDAIADAERLADLAADEANVKREKLDTDAASKIFDKTRSDLEIINSKLEAISGLIERGASVGLEDAFERQIEELETARQLILDALSGKTLRDEVSASLIEETRTPLERVQQQLADVQAQIGTFGDTATEDAILRKIATLKKIEQTITAALSGETDRVRLGESIVDETRTPLEQVQMQLLETSQLVGTFGDDVTEDAINRKLDELNERRNKIIRDAAAEGIETLSLQGSFSAAGVARGGIVNADRQKELDAITATAKNTKDINDRLRQTGGLEFQ